jgi:uncharacterized protein (DUF2147 family)
MLTSSLRRTAAALLLLGLGASPLFADDEFIGTWQTERGEAQIRIAKCGAQLCGTVAWLRDPLDPKTGKPQLDELNPNPAMQNRPVLGLRIFAMSQDATGSWTGPIYNADDGQTYRGRLAPRGHTEIEVNGCAKRLCGSEVWKRIK